MRTVVHTLVVVALVMMAFGCGDEPEGDNDAQNNDENNATQNQNNDANDENDNNDANDNNQTGNNGEDPNGDYFQCVNTCEENSDCDQGIGWECVDGFCDPGDPDDEPGCEDDAECVARYSGWSENCESQSDCNELNNEICVEYEGSGWCAFTPGQGFGCDDAGLEEIELELVGEEGEEEPVCIDDRAVCSDSGHCEEACSSDDDCDGSGGADTCLDDSTCGCGSDDSCEDIPGADTCYDGVCGCGDDDSCDDEQVCRGF